MLKQRVSAILICTLISCSDARINEQQVDVGHVTFNPSLVEQFYTNDRLSAIADTSEFSLVSSFEVKEGNRKYLVELRKIRRWSDPGDFHRLTIKEGDLTLMDEVNFDGWVRFNKNYLVAPSLEKSNKLESDLAFLRSSKRGPWLYLFGWVYASEPGLMTVVEFGDDPVIIFNKQFSIFSIETDSTGYDLVNGTLNYEDTVTLRTLQLEISRGG